VNIPEDLLNKMREHSWFHAIDLGDGNITRGRFPTDTPQNQTLFPAMEYISYINVAGMDCLDIGATDGLISFGLEKLGAKSVTATDRVEGVGFGAVHALLQSKVDLRFPIEIDNILTEFEGRYFDLIICAGVIYHMLNPASAFMACRNLLKPGGLLIVDSALSFTSDKAIMVFNPEVEEFNEDSTYWLPTFEALAGIAKLCHFEVLSGRRQPATSRGTVLCRALLRSESVPEGTALLKDMHKLGLLDAEFHRRMDATEVQPASKIRYTGPHNVVIMNPQTFVPHFPLHVNMIDERKTIG
jgi:tRNA (mo5U34)-methyltransferase